MLSVAGLTRRFGDHLALDHVSFDVVPGRMTGFVGANGAGKTTTMRIMVGVLAATNGKARWNGERGPGGQRRLRLHAGGGAVPEDAGPRAVRVLRTPARKDSARATERANKILERLGLAERARDVLETLSLGNQQRAQIAAALVHEPIA